MKGEIKITIDKRLFDPDISFLRYEIEKALKQKEYYYLGGSYSDTVTLVFRRKK